jgi:hypothetical protein
VETKALTYAELGAALGITPASAKRLAIRRAWAKTAGNDGKARVAVPVERLEVEHPVTGDDTGETTRDITGDDTSDATGDITSDKPDLSAAVAILERHTGRLEGELAAMRVKLETVESERDAERARAGQVAVLEAVLEIERTRLAEARTEAERWREAATAPRGLWAWFRRA